MLDYGAIDANAAAIADQLDRFIGFGKGEGGTGSAAAVNNRDWLADLNYIEFLRDIGSHFSVNRMLTFEAYKVRMETGLSFIEFNYQLLQSYDFLELYRRRGCCLQIGGDDQWGNIVAGVDLVRRVEGAEVFGMTFPLVTTADGVKMGKTAKGALFLDPAQASPYDFFQYWRNTQDADVLRFLLMFTFLPADECRALTAPGRNPNDAKERLAWEVTALIHGREEADGALAGAKAAFAGEGDRSAMPRAVLPRARFEEGYGAARLFLDAGLAASLSEARRLIEQGGASVSGTAVADPAAVVGAEALDADGTLVLRAGKKRFCLAVAQ